MYINNKLYKIIVRSLSTKILKAFKIIKKNLIIVAICILHIDIPEKKLRNSFIDALKTIARSRKRCRFKPSREKLLRNKYPYDLCSSGLISV